MCLKKAILRCRLLLQNRCTFGPLEVGMRLSVFRYHTRNWQKNSSGELVSVRHEVEKVFPPNVMEQLGEPFKNA